MPGPAQTAIFESAPGGVHAGSPPAVKVAFYATLFAARVDGRKTAAMYATHRRTA